MTHISEHMYRFEHKIGNVCPSKFLNMHKCTHENQTCSYVSCCCCCCCCLLLLLLLLLQVRLICNLTIPSVSGQFASKYKVFRFQTSIFNQTHLHKSKLCNRKTSAHSACRQQAIEEATLQL